MVSVPQASFAIIGGSASWGLRFPEDIDEPGITVVARDLAFETEWGTSEEWKLIEIDGSRTVDGQPRRVLYVFSHGWPLIKVDHHAHQKTYGVLETAGVQKVLAMSTAGSLNRAIYHGDFVVAADVLELTQTMHSVMPGRLEYNSSGKQIICPAFARIMEHAAREVWPSHSRVHGHSAGLVAGHSWGPRLQTPAEVLAYRSLGADFINHSLAPDATLAREINACFTNCTFITAGFSNYFAPRGQATLTEGMLESLAPAASIAALRAIARIPLETDCGCQDMRIVSPEAYKARR
jgi:5'-methylthioadenosine phosphorylase